MEPRRRNRFFANLVVVSSPARPRNYRGVFEWEEVGWWQSQLKVGSPLPQSSCIFTCFGEVFGQDDEVLSSSTGLTQTTTPAVTRSVQAHDSIVIRFSLRFQLS